MATTNRSNRPPRSGKGRFVKSVDTAERAAKACRMRQEGHTFDEIAKALGYADRGKAHQAVEQGILSIVAEPAAQVRAMELARLDRLLVEAWGVMTAEHIVVSNGRVALHPDTDLPLVDSGPKLAAMDRVLKIMERRARYLGLDVPTKIDVQYEQVEAQIASEMARLYEMPAIEAS